MSLFVIVLGALAWLLNFIIVTYGVMDVGRTGKFSSADGFVFAIFVVNLLASAFLSFSPFLFAN